MNSKNFIIPILGLSLILVNDRTCLFFKYFFIGIDERFLMTWYSILRSVVDIVNVTWDFSKVNPCYKLNFEDSLDGTSNVISNSFSYKPITIIIFIMICFTSRNINDITRSFVLCILSFVEDPINCLNNYKRVV